MITLLILTVSPIYLSLKGWENKYFLNLGVKRVHCQNSTDDEYHLLCFSPNDVMTAEQCSFSGSVWRPLTVTISRALSPAAHFNSRKRSLRARCLYGMPRTYEDPISDVF